MKIAVFSSKPYDNQFLTRYSETSAIKFSFFDTRLTVKTAQLAKGFDGVCVFVNDELNKQCLTLLANYGVTIVALRCAGFNNLDLQAAKSLGISVCRVPEYSPEAVAEHTIGLILTLSRKFHKAYNRVKEDNFSLQGLLGFNLHGKTAGIVGGGHIGVATIRILQGFGCHVQCFDPAPSDALKATGAQLVSQQTLLETSDIISLHCPLNKATQYLINQQSLKIMKPGSMLINTSRGGLVDTKAVIDALKSGQLGYLGLDVYEQEASLFFEDLSDQVVQDDEFQRLLTFPNVVITGHQGFLTEQALIQIAQTTIASLQAYNRNDYRDKAEFIVVADQSVS